MTMNIIFNRLFSSIYLKPVTKNVTSKYLKQNNVFTKSAINHTRVLCYSSSSSGKNENDKDKPIEADDTSKLEVNSTLPSNTKNRDVLIEPTKYHNPVVSEKNFEENFWRAYQDKIATEHQDSDFFPDRIRYRKVYNNPYERTYGILKDDILEFFGRLKRNPLVYIRNPTLETRVPNEKQIFPHHCDVVIIGGGIVGTSIAFHIQEKARQGLQVVVVEKDMSYSKASTVLSVGGIRQQFSTPENIILSKYGMDFLQQADSRLATKDNPSPNIDLTFSGYLTLASEQGFHQLQENFDIQRKCGAHVEMFTKDKLKSLFPWLNTEGVEAGVYGVQREGWFDPWSLLLSMSRKARELGTEYVNGTVIDSTFKSCGDRITVDNQPSHMKQIRSIMVKLPDGETREINCAVCIIAAGAWSKDVGKILGVGTDPIGYNSIPIPVEPRKRYVYCVKSPNGPNLNCPLLVDTNGTYFRREGLADLYLCGRAPTPEEEPSNDDLEVDYDFFENQVWPSIAHRCPSFESLKVHSSWAGYYDYNSFDQNAIIGQHPLFANLYLATGFSGHGIQQAAGAGCAISELVINAELKTLNIEKLGFERILVSEPIIEKCCY